MKNDVVWNFISFGVVAVSGLLMNLVISHYYDSAILGIFNETYAWYAILSQIAVWGIHMAVLKFVSETESDYERATLLKTSIFASVLNSTVIILVVEVVITSLPYFAWKQSLRIGVIGLLFFAINKILLNYLNAIYKMKGYAFFQAFRCVLIVVFLLIFSLWQYSPDYLSLSFVITEGIVFFAIYLYIRVEQKQRGVFDFETFKKVISFGTKILPSNMVTEMNTKVDIVCLGFFVKETSQIGVYSFAILFAEGFYTLLFTLRRFVNPDLAIMYVNKQLNIYVDNLIKRKLKMVLFFFIVLFMILVAYYTICPFIGSDEYTVGLVYITVIGAAIAMNSVKIILGDVLAQTGFPLEESTVNVITIVSNFIFNVVLINLFGTMGAAIATAASYFVYRTCLKFFVSKKLKIRI